MSKRWPISIAILMGLLMGCERDIDIDLPESEENLVVEGYIEAGQPPFVILTHDQSYFDETNLNSISNLFIDSANANVKVWNSQDTVQLQPISSQALPPQAREQLASLFQVDAEDLAEDFNFIAYTYLSPGFQGQPGQSYEFYAKTAKYQATAKTTIPDKARLDSLYQKKPSNSEKSDVARVFMRIDDPLGKPHNYRYFTKRNDEPFYPPLFGSVANDEAVDGTTFNFPVDRGYARSANLAGQEDLNFFEKGDTVVVRFCSIDREHYKFWSTLEEDLRNQGNPFGSPTIIQSNINGGLGIWGGYNCDYDTIVVR